MKNRSLVLLSGEGTPVPAAEARALFLAYDPGSRFESPDPRVLIAESSADPFLIGSRIAFARRVGRLVDERAQLVDLVGGRRVRFRGFDLLKGGRPPDPADYLTGLDVSIDLEHPDLEVTLVRSEEDLIAVTAPGGMSQSWSERRPRRRPFFHPSAMFPKLSRALVNLSRCRAGEAFLDPFVGTGSIPLEAHLIGAKVVAVDLAEKMVRGAARNMERFGQDWLGIIRADSATLPLHAVGAVATDIPYGRASSTLGRRPEDVVGRLLPQLSDIMAPRSFMVIMHPRDQPVAGLRGLRLLEEHDLHVHKLLTRTISVLERR